MKEFVYGVIFGVLMIVYAVFFILQKTRRVPILSQVPEEWPKPLEDFIKRQLATEEVDNSVGNVFMSPTVDIAWLNLIFTRLFLSLRSSKSYKEMTLQRISKNMNLNIKKGLLVIHAL